MNEIANELTGLRVGIDAIQRLAESILDTLAEMDETAAEAGQKAEEMGV